jgi:predicted KAP-like P-loop ATPase
MNNFFIIYMPYIILYKHEVIEFKKMLKVRILFFVSLKQEFDTLLNFHSNKLKYSYLQFFILNFNSLYRDPDSLYYSLLMANSILCIRIPIL